MKKSKRFLALLLVLCLAIGLVPFSVFAAENAEAEAVETEAAEAEGGAQLLALSQKPADGQTKAQPFAKGTGGSQNFRIPGIVTLDSGRLVASCDARWNHTGDGAGLDTIVSWSDDNGQNWHYTFANYLGDNGNVKNELSTSFIDPAVGTDGQTVYMIADLFPAAIALNTSKHAPVAGKNGLDDQGRLLLRKNTLSVSAWDYAKRAANASYDFYLEGNQIHQMDGTVVEDYTVDAYFNITGTGVSTNLFCSDSPYQPYPTNYLYLTTSTDGQTWSAPQLLNLKNSDEQTLLVGPGNGVYDANTGNMIFTAYEHTGGTERTSLIWMDARGGWHRSADANFVGGKSSEASAVVLPDSTVRVFYRNNSNNLDYTDFTWDSAQYVPGSTGVVAGASKTQNNQLSAILYSQQVNGQDLVLVSAAAGSGTSRVNGQIYAIAVGENNSMKLLNSYDVVPGTDDHYDYSCLTETNNGDIAMLYENNVGSGEITFKTMPIEDVVPSMGQTPDPEPAPDAEPDKSENVQLLAGESKPAAVLPTVQKDLSASGSVMDGGLEIAAYTVESVQSADIGGVQGGVLGQPVTSFVQDQQYAIVSNGWALTCSEAGDLATVKLSSDTPVPAEALWTISGDSASGYTIQHGSYTLGYAQSEWSIIWGTEYDYALTTADSDFQTFSMDKQGRFYQYLISSSFLGSSYENFYFDFNAGDGYTAVGADYVDGAKAYDIAVEQAGTPGQWSHQVHFTGKTGGEGSVTIGNVTYHVTVTNRQETVQLSVNQEKNFSCDGAIVKQPDSRVATAKLQGTGLVIRGVAAGSTTMIAGGVEYTVQVSDVPLNPNTEETIFISGTGVGHQDGGETINGPVTKLTLSKGLSYDLNLKNGMRADSWRVEDPSIASVDRSGNVTGKSVGETRVIATVNGVEYSIPVVIKDFRPGSDYRIYNFYASEITDTTVYYIWNNDSQLIPLIEGEAIYVSFNKKGNDCCNFFAAPNEGYALTRMSSTNSLGHYFLLHTGDHRTIDTSDIGFVNGHVDGAQGAGVNQQGVWGSRPGSKLYNSVQTAINAMCDGGMGFTRTPDAGDANCRLTFRSEKLPSVAKEVLGVLGTDGVTYREYVPGMTAQQGEKVYYRITVEKYASEDAITYNNVKLEDRLNGSKPSGLEVFRGDGHGNPGASVRNPATITSEISGDGLRAGQHIYFAAYTIQNKDLDTTLVNRADLTFNYKSHYSSGAFDASASAVAEITATTFQAKDLVVDFGLPVTVHYDSWGKSVQLTGGSAQYGNVSVQKVSNGWDVTYTPTAVLQGVDIVTMNASNGAKYQFHIYPATTVFYEEKLAAELSGFATTGISGRGEQEAQLAGTEGMNFGQTNGYSGTEAQATNGTMAVSNVLDSTGKIAFTGTGIDLYAACASDSGVVLVLIRDDQDMVEKFYQVDTRIKPGVTDATDNTMDRAYGLPIVSVRDLSYGTHTVELRHVARDENDQGASVYLDAFRVYGTMSDLAHEAYPSSEKNPRYLELRDALLSTMSVEQDLAGQEVVDQVYDKTGTTAGVVVINDGGIFTDEKRLDVLNNGPKNELFIYPGEVMVFTLNQAAQLGMKAVNGAVELTMNGQRMTIGTTAEMFYDVAQGSVTIRNNSRNILSLTLVKHFGDSAKVFGEVDAEQMTYAVRMLYAGAPAEETEAKLTVSLTDYTGKELGKAELSAAGTAGEEHIFTAEEIAEAARAQLGGDYALVDESAITDTAVVCGEEDSMSVQIGLVGVLHVTYIKRERQGLFGKVRETEVGSADFTVVQNSKKAKGKVSGADIRAGVPEGCRAGFLTGGQKVRFGSEKSVRITVR